MRSTAATEAFGRLGADSSMQCNPRALVALITASIVLAVPAAGGAAPRHKPSPVDPKHHRVNKPPKKLALPASYAEWSRVAICEEGGWRVGGYNYPDSLGIDRTNYLNFGGTPQPPGPVSMANRALQIKVAERLRARYHISIPDQGGCAAW